MNILSKIIAMNFEDGTDVYGKQKFEVGDIANKIKGISTADDIRPLIIGWLNFFLGFVAIICLILIIYGGISIVFSEGDEAKVKKGIQLVVMPIIGLIIIIISYAIVKIFFP